MCSGVDEQETPAPSVNPFLKVIQVSLRYISVMGTGVFPDGLVTLPVCYCFETGSLVV